MEQEFVISSLGELEELAGQVAGSLRGGEVLALSGDLGAGKTAFVQALARGLGIAQPVVSPTFVLERQYQADRGFTLHHFDWYRLDDPQAIRELGLEDLFGRPSVVVAIEWPERAMDLLPADALRIHFEDIGEGRRRVTIDFRKSK